MAYGSSENFSEMSEQNEETFCQNCRFPKRESSLALHIISQSHWLNELSLLKMSFTRQ
jgi:hypothetical protein